MTIVLTDGDGVMCGDLFVEVCMAMCPEIPSCDEHEVRAPELLDKLSNQTPNASLPSREL